MTTHWHQRVPQETQALPPNSGAKAHGTGIHRLAEPKFFRPLQWRRTSFTRTADSFPGSLYNNCSDSRRTRTQNYRREVSGGLAIARSEVLESVDKISPTHAGGTK